MKLKNLFYLLLAAPLAFAACNETPEPEPQPKPEPEKNPTLTLTSAATMEFEAVGGEGVITYTLENAVEGTELTAACEADWVLNLTAGETVTFVNCTYNGVALAAANITTVDGEKTMAGTYEIK
jgi:hypothetical protein